MVLAERPRSSNAAPTAFTGIGFPSLFLPEMTTPSARTIKQGFLQSFPSRMPWYFFGSASGMRSRSELAGWSCTSSVRRSPGAIRTSLPLPTLWFHSRKPQDVTCNSRFLSEGTRTGSLEDWPPLKIGPEGFSADITVTSIPEIGAPVLRFVRWKSRKPAGGGRWRLNSASGCPAVSSTSEG
jgi:hypothetical protein